MERTHSTDSHNWMKEWRGIKINQGLPFKHLGATGWLNLAMAALFLFYLSQIGWALFNHDLLVTLGGDYRGFWSTGYTANTQGYAYIYDLNALAQVQKDISAVPIAPSPTPFFPIFILPFQALALLNPVLSFWIWTILNLVGLVLYLNFFAKNVAPGKESPRLFLVLLLSFSFFQNLYWGQINVWLVICVGEFMRAAMQGKNIKGGLWLAGLLLKPQILVLIFPILVIQRSWKLILGFLAGSAAVLFASLGIDGINGILNLIRLWLDYLPGIATNAPENMMNWRMLALHFSAYTSPFIGWGMALIGFAITIIAAVYIWRKPISADSPQYVVALLGTFAASGAVAWHAHAHMAMILFPFLIYLFLNNQISLKTIGVFAFLPSITMIVIYLLGILMVANIIPVQIGFGGLLLGTSGLWLNIYLLYWSIKTLNPHNTTTRNNSAQTI